MIMIYNLVIPKSLPIWCLGTYTSPCIPMATRLPVFQQYKQIQSQPKFPNKAPLQTPKIATNS